METDNDVKVPRLMTTKQLADATGIPRWRLFELVKQGKAPPHMRVGNTLRFPVDGVVEWIREQTNNHRETVA